MTWAMVGSAAVSAGSAWYQSSQKNKADKAAKNASQMSPEQRALANNQLEYSNQGLTAGKSLMDYYQSGQFGDFTAGKEYQEQLGDYGMTDMEGAGQEAMNSMIQGGAPELNRLGAAEYKDLLTTDKYNPMAEGNKDAYFNPYMKELKKSQQDQSDILDRNMGVTGSLYSSARDDQQRQLGEETQDQANMMMSGLYTDYMNKRLSGASEASRLGNMQQAMEMERIQGAHQYGQLQRVLADTQAKDAYNDWLRQRSEYSDVINTARSMYATGAGVGSVSPASAYDLANFQSKTQMKNYAQQQSDQAINKIIKTYGDYANQSAGIE